VDPEIRSTRVTSRNSLAADHAMLTPQELSNLLAVPLATIYRWRTRGEGPEGFRVGRHVRFRLEDVERWLDQNRDSVLRRR